MSEKNTSSILQTIKKKLHKLDKKSESNDQPTQVDDEFQYISSGDKAKKDAAPEKLPSLNDAESIKSSPKVDQPSASSESLKSDVLNFDDLDLDNEEGVSAKSVTAPSSPVPPVQSSSAGSKMSDSLESSPMDWLKDTNTSSSKVAVDSKVQNQSTPAIGSLPGDDLDFLSASSDNVLAQSNNAVSATPQDNMSNQASALGKDDLDLASLGLDEEHKDPIVAALAEVKKPQDPILEPKIDDLDLNLDDLGGDDKQKNVEVMNPVKEHDDLDFGDLNLDSHEEVKTVDNVVEEKQKDDDLDFEGLDEELKKELEGHLDKVEENKSSTVKDSDLQHDDFLKDISLPDSQQENQDPLGMNNASAAVSSDPLAFDSGVMSEEKIKVNQASAAPNLMNENMISGSSESKSDGMDFDFESELMGDGIASSSSASTVAPDTNQSAVVQEQVQAPQKIEVIPTQKSAQVNNNINLIVDPSEMKAMRVLSEDTVKQVSDSVKRLVDAKNVVSGVANFSQSPALGEIAAQLMEPKIDKWFNDNLPDLVERIVREEIKKLIPKE